MTRIKTFFYRSLAISVRLAKYINLQLKNENLKAYKSYADSCGPYIVTNNEMQELLTLH